MLKNQEAVSEAPGSETPVSVSQARVTPDELTQALAAIEAKRQAEASRLAGTIPIDQAVSELHLDSTPDEIWAEVQAQRAKAAAAVQETPRRAQEQQNPQEKRQAQIVPPLEALFHTLQTRAEARRRLFARRRGRERHSGWIGILPPLLIGWVLIQTNLVPHFWNHLNPTHISAPVLRPLIQVPDGQEVYADDAALVQVSEGKPVAKISVSLNNSGNRWKIVRQNGHVYLRGYIAETSSLLPLQGKPLNVYNDDNSGELRGEATSNVTVRVDGTPLQQSSGDSDFSGITVPNFQPDPLTTLSPWR